LVTTRRGASSIGCLFGLLVLAAVVYFGVNVGEAYWRFYQFRDDMQQEARFAAHNANDAILSRLRSAADSLGLPEAAAHVIIRRVRGSISIESYYDEPVELPGHVRELHFHPRAEGPL
jgi:hypothetical protein